MKFHFLILAVFLAVPGLAAKASSPPEITADAAVIMDSKDGSILYEKNGAKREYPASLTKIMTCLLSVEKGNPYGIMEISPEAADVVSTALNGGEWITLENLRTQMMLISDNGAATAIAENLCGSLPDFINEMNKKAKSLGMDNTHFVNANGMPDEDHYSTARDLAKLSRHAMENKNFRRIVSTKSRRIHYEKPRTDFYCENSNALLFTYPGATGIKTGYTRAAGGCLAASAMGDNHEIIVILLHSQDMVTRFPEAEKLLNYGFELLKEEKVSSPPSPGKKKKHSSSPVQKEE